MDEEEEFTLAMGRGVWIDDDPIKVQAALDKGFDPNYYDNDGATTLHRAAEAGCAKALEIFLNHDIARIDLKDHMQQTPLHYAARCGDSKKAIQICAILLKAGLDIDAESNDVDYPTPLFLCIKYQNINLAAYLLEHGADIDVLNFSDATLLLQLQADSVSYPLCNLKEMLALLLYYNVDVNCPWNSHPLFVGIQMRNDNIIRPLFDFAEFDSSLGTHTYPNVGYVLTMKLDTSIMLDFFLKLDLTVITMIELMLQTGQLRDLDIFNFFYKRLQSRISCIENYSIFSFFYVNCLPKHDFVTAIQALFDCEFGRVWSSQSICNCLPILFGKIKSDLNLQIDDMANVLYHTLQFVNEIPLEVLRRVFSLSHFSDDFELILKCDPLVSQTLEPCFRQAYYGGDDGIFLQICFPSHLRLRNNNGKYNVHSLKYYSRNVIRQHLRCEDENVFSFVGLKHIFSYYNNVQKLEIPQIIKDIITMKCNVE